MSLRPYSAFFIATISLWGWPVDQSWAQRKKQAPPPTGVEVCTYASYRCITNAFEEGRSRRPQRTPPPEFPDALLEAHDPKGKRQVLFATNRAITNAQLLPQLPAIYSLFSEKLSTEIVWGWIRFTYPLDRQPGDQNYPRFEGRDNMPNQFTDIVAEAHGRIYASTSFIAEIARMADLGDRPDGLLYIHGMNNRFIEAGITTAQLAVDLKFPGPILFFSWPSNDNLGEPVTDYHYAQRMLVESVSDLKDAWDVLATTGRPLNVIAHSLGAKLFAATLSVDQGTPVTAPRFRARSAFLTAPAIGTHSFNNNYRDPLLADGGVITIYCSPDDKILPQSEAEDGEPSIGLCRGGVTLTEPSGVVSLRRDDLGEGLLQNMTLKNVTLRFPWHYHFAINGTVLGDIEEALNTLRGPRSRRGMSFGNPYWALKR